MRTIIGTVLIVAGIALLLLALYITIRDVLDHDDHYWRDP